MELKCCNPNSRKLASSLISKELTFVVGNTCLCKESENGVNKNICLLSKHICILNRKVSNNAI